MCYNRIMEIFVQSYLQSQTFFFISSIGFIILGIMLAVFLFYLIRSTHTLSRIMKKAEKDIDEMGDTTQEILEEVRDSTIFNFIFKKKKKRIKK